jgi:hypothetical protein
MSLEVLKAWAASQQALQASSPNARQALLEVYVGCVELLEMVAQTVGKRDFSDLLFLRFPTASLFLHERAHAPFFSLSLPRRLHTHTLYLFLTIPLLWCAHARAPT